MARLAGRTGRTAISEWSQMHDLNGIDTKRSKARLSPIPKKSTTTVETTTRTTAITIDAPKDRDFDLLPALNVQIDHRKNGKTKINFKNVRFVPLHDEKNGILRRFLKFAVFMKCFKTEWFLRFNQMKRNVQDVEF